MTKLGDIKHNALRFTIGTLIDDTVKNYKKNPDKVTENLLKLNNIAKKYFSDMYSERAFDTAEKLISEKDNKWYEFFEKALNEIHPNIIKQMTLNLGYEAAFYGNKKLRESREKYDCPVPWVILMDPTSACNLKCTGCWAAEYGYKMSLDYETLSKIVREGRELGTYFYMLTGGEPLVRKEDILKLAEEYNDCAFNIFTNGTLIDEDFCKEVQRLGNIVFSISVEGVEKVNDERRGDGVYKKVMNAFDIMKEYGLLYGTSICYTSQNYKSVTSDEFLDTLIDKGVRYNWYFHYMPVGNSASTELLLDAEQRAYMIKRVREIRGMEGGKPIFCLDFQNDGEYVGGCIAGGRNYFHINANGDVEPCVFIHYSNVNIKESTVLEALQSPLFQAFRKNQPFNENLLRPCPMLENPEILQELVYSTKAHSTDLVYPESVEHLTNKCYHYAKDWSVVSEEIWKNTKKKVRVYNNYYEDIEEKIETHMR